MNLGKIRGWIRALPPELDHARLCVMSTSGKPIPAPGIALAHRATDQELVLAVLGPNKRICGDWEPVAALDEREWAETPIPERARHAGLMLFMRGFTYGAAGSAFTPEQMAEPNWRRGWEAGRAAKTAAYVEGCAFYETELNVLREQDGTKKT